MSLELHNLKSSTGARRSKKRLGRGNASGHGTTATRGTKGQRARQGGRRGLIQLGVKHFVSRLPKMRGFASFKSQPRAVPIAVLTKFAPGTVVTPKFLYHRGVLARADDLVKLIGGGGKLPKLTVKVHAASQGARAAVEKAGGTVEILPSLDFKKQSSKPQPKA